jgi:hypothetical protein
MYDRNLNRNGTQIHQSHKAGWWQMPETQISIKMKIANKLEVVKRSKTNRTD